MVYHHEEFKEERKPKEKYIYCSCRCLETPHLKDEHGAWFCGICNRVKGIL